MVRVFPICHKETRNLPEKNYSTFEGLKRLQDGRCRIEAGNRAATRHMILTIHNALHDARWR